MRENDKDSERPPHDVGERPSEPTGAGDANPSASLRATLEKVLPELLKRGVEAGRDTLQRSETLRQVVGEGRASREWATLLAAHMDEAKSGMVRAIAAEFGRFLREAELGAEIAKVLSNLSLEIKAEVRFVPSQDARAVEPQVTAKVKASRTAGEDPSAE